MCNNRVGLIAIEQVLFSYGSVSVFQVGIGFSIHRSVFFQVGSVFVVCFSKYRDIGSVFSVFHFASIRHVRILKVCFGSSHSADF